jgi:hypothetical protein
VQNPGINLLKPIAENINADQLKFELDSSAISLRHQGPINFVV